MKKFRLMILIVLSILYINSPSWAGPTLDVGVRGTYEDNINGSTTDANKEGDYSTTVSAAIGGYTEVVSRTTYLFLKGGGDRSYYNKYPQLDATVGYLSAGVYHRMGDVLSMQITAKGRDKDFEGTTRDSTSYGGAFELKQQLTSSFWIKEGFEYEKNDAKSDSLDYKGQSAGIWAGIRATPNTFLGIGYSYLLRKYELTNFESTSRTISGSIAWKMVSKIYANAGYDRQINDSDAPGTKYYNNIHTVGLSYSY